MPETSSLPAARLLLVVPVVVQIAGPGRKIFAGESAVEAVFLIASIGLQLDVQT